MTYPKTIFLPRPDLTEKALAAIEGHVLTVVAAPMGYGKTTLCRAILGRLEKNAWLCSVPAGPHDARFLWHDMCERFEERA